MPRIRWSWTSTVVATALCAATPTALAQDAGGMDASTGDVTVTDAADAEGGASLLCPDAVRSVSAPVAFTRSGPVDFGPGTGMRMVGDRSTVGLEYNLLFSGRYETGMRGQLNVRWPRSLTITAEGEPMGGYLDVTFGLRMLGRLYVLGVGIDLPLSYIIDDHEGHGRSVFTPWAWNYEGTDVHLNVSAWRTIYRRSFYIGGDEYPVELMARYNMVARIRTLEIGFPDRSMPNAIMNISQITRDMPEAIYPPPRNGDLELLTRWKAQLRYEGRIELRVVVRRRVCAYGICSTVDFSAPEFPIVVSRETLPDPFDQAPRFQLPVARVDLPELDFGDVRIGESVTQNLQVFNDGLATLGVEATPPAEMAFTVGPGACIRARSSGNIPITFTPPRVGTFRTELTLNGNGTIGSPTTVVLVGNGVTTMTRPPSSRRDAGRLPDGGRVGDGGEYFGPEIEATCGCRTVGGPNSRSARAMPIVATALGAMLLLRRRRK